MHTGNPKSFRPTVQQLESREVMSVATVQLANSVLTVQTNAEDSNVTVVHNSSNITVRDAITDMVWNYPRSQVSRLIVSGSSGNDSFTSVGASGLVVNLYGRGGNDYLEGDTGGNILVGGPGNDRIFGRGGNDTLKGYDGNDFIFGGIGNDTITGDAGNDNLIGGQGADAISGSTGDDVLVTIDGALTDVADAGTGTDTVWVDLINGVQEAVTGLDGLDFIRPVAAFANGADTTLTGDRIPVPGLVNGTDEYETFIGRPLFADVGPTLDDINQTTDDTGNVILDDSWLLSSLGSMLEAYPNLIKTNVVDFGDGTYGVRFNGTFYRVDNRFPVSQFGSTLPTYAGVGAQNSLWVAVIEKAAATGTSTQNASYLLIDNTFVAGGITPTVANALFGAPTQNFNVPGSFVNSSQLGVVLEQAVNSNFAVVFTETGGQSFTLVQLLFDSNGDVLQLVFRDPSAGYFNVGIDTLFAASGRLSFGDFNNV